MALALKHPARHYLLYLLSTRLYDVKGVLAAMGELGLPVPTDVFDLENLTLEILRVRATLTFPIPFNPQAAAPTPATTAWLKRWRVQDVWRGHKAVAAATELLAEPTIRHMLELLLLGPLSASAIAQRLADRFDLPSHAMHAGVVRAYAHYFWDVDALDPGQWRHFIEVHCKGSRVEYVAALQAPRSRAGAAFVIALADKDPQALSPADRYEAASTMAFGMMMHHALAEAPSTGRTYAAFTALNMMRMADEQLALHRGASSDLISQLERLKPIYDPGTPLRITDAPYIQRPVLESQNPEVVDAPQE